MDLNVLQQALDELEARRADLDKAIAGLKYCMSLEARDAPKQPFENAKVVKHPKEPVGLAFSEPEPVRAARPQQPGETTPSNEMRSWRKARGLSQAAVAKLVGTATANIGHIEHGRQKITERYREAMEIYDKANPGKAAPAQPPPGSRF